MNNKIIKEFLKNNNGYITTGDIENLGVSRTKIPLLVKEGVIRKVFYGIYVDNDLIEDEYFLIQKRFSDVIFSYNTAFHLLNLSERAPYKLDITTISGKHIKEDLQIHYVSEEKLNIGVIEMKSPYGNLIKVYNAERCICDMLKNREEYDIELYSKIIHNYFNSKNKNLKLLEEYARIFNVQEKLNIIMEVLMD